MATYKTPGVYIEEIPKLPPSIAEVETAIPAFIGYTQLQSPSAKTVSGFSVDVQRVTSLLEYETIFGTAFPASITVTILDSMNGTAVKSRSISTSLDNTIVNTMYYHLQMYFANGGGPCYIVSVGVANDANGTTIDKDALKAGLDTIKKYDEPTLLLFPEAVNLPVNPADSAVADDLDDAQGAYDTAKSALETAKTNLFHAQQMLDEDTSDPKTPLLVSNLASAKTAYAAAVNPTNGYYVAKNALAVAQAAAQADSQSAVDAANLYNDALAQAASLKDRFVILDCYNDDATMFRNSIGNNNLKYGAAYHPFLQTSLGYVYTDASVYVDHRQDTNGNGNYNIPVVYGYSNLLSAVNTSLNAGKDTIYNLAKLAAAGLNLTLNPSATVAGVYASVDSTRGVWKAPANVSLNYVTKPTKAISDLAQESLNVDPDAGKSINAIRSFTGKGTLVWGARTLAGNDNEWRYISVRRFFNMVEESAKKATGAFVFESNDANTWVKIQGMVENYLTTLWRAGALQGAKPEHAFYVSVGLGKTMTAQDILEGRLYVEIGMAVVRPAEFIILRFSHMLAQS